MLRKIGYFFGILFFIALFTLVCLAAVHALAPTDFRDTTRYTIKSYYVESGDCAWDIYSSTCAAANWDDWCSFVTEENNLDSIGVIRAGTVLFIPIPIE
jgi:hypothetical protein